MRELAAVWSGVQKPKTRAMSMYIIFQFSFILQKYKEIKNYC